MKKLKKKILIVTPHFYPENFIINDFVKKLSKKFNFFVITSFPHYPNKNYFKDYGINKIYQKQNESISILRLPVLGRFNNNKFLLSLNYLSYLISFLIFLPIILFVNFNSIFVFQTSPITVAIPGIILKYFKKKKIYLWVLDVWPEVITSVTSYNKNSFIFKILDSLTKLIYTCCDVILISSRKFRNNVESKVKKKKIIFFPQWAVNSKSRKKNRKHLFAKNKNFKIFYIGNMGEAQDLSSVFKTIKLCYQKKINVSWHFVGDGSDKKNFQKKIINNNLQNYVKFYGSVKQNLLGEYYKNSDALLLSLKKSKILKLYLPAKLSGYLFHGKPILVMADGDSYNLVNDFKSGFVAKSGDYKKLTSNIDILTKLNKRELKKFNLNSISLYNKYFNSKNTLKKIEKLFDELN